MKYFKEQLDLFRAENKSRQFIFIAIILIGIGSIGLVGIWIIAPTYSVLFNHLSTQDANQILVQLETANIPYKILNHGSTILVDKRVVDQTRIKIMSTGMQLSQNLGFELFDKNDFGMTDFSQKINYQRALQGELERTITSLDEVQQARVHLVIPDNHLFQEETNQPHAAITLHLIHPLTPTQVHSIQKLVSASVANMSIKNVILVDQQGESLTNIAHEPTHLHDKKEMESYLSKKVITMLHPIFKDKEVVVKVDVTLNYDQIEREFTSPQLGGQITHEKETEHTLSSTTAKKEANHDLMREKSYEFGHQKERYKRARGQIERITISIVVPQETPQPTLERIEHLVKSIIGFNMLRGDSISVEALALPRAAHSNTQPPKLEKSSQSLFPRKITILSIVSIAFLFLFVLWLRRLQKRRHTRQYLLTELSLWLTSHD